MDKIVDDRIKPNEQQIADSGKVLVTSEEALKEAEQRQKDADADAKHLEEKKKKADALAKKITDASKPKDLTVTLFTNPFTLKVREAPIELKSFGNQTVKAGERVDLDLAIDRLFGFSDQVSFKVVLPSSAKGITAKAATIAKDAYVTTLELVTNATSTAAGEFECKLEGTLKFNNQNIKFTETFVLKVEPAPAEKKTG